ncbi:CO(2)-response secreted protease isoform X2 [Brachypodium distachyon]|uniref:CO(2)-response secreted protease isoform X2 n=1 Tax=Brachypodium distachyon TaxID=15368 RepID=UPI00071DC461|nr:CO(2)-response secreted protease isoform X2 [Brachypodium distachyon]|eukprot:XP_014753845.1 CO(2)-response secreted protease isoform X2 [Brachypodium distachyon]
MVNRAHFVILVLAYRLLSYVVYMGGGGGRDAEAARAAHLQMLSSVAPMSGEEERASSTLTHSYHHAFEGFAAELTVEEAAALAAHERVVSVFRDRTLQLHTTRSWDFLDAQSGLRPDRLAARASADVIIGVIDSGVWPESPSFNDVGMGAVPARWRGVCMEGPDFNKTNCNKKLIGARYYGNEPGGSKATVKPPSTTATDSPRDTDGHGTHCTSTAAGAAVSGADYYGLGRAGPARGGAPGSRVAAYRACILGGCSGSALLKAIDDAVSDGVDVISMSVGVSSAFPDDFLSDPIAIGAFHAHRRGVLVVCSAGNDGPVPYTVVNAAPWIVTVAASTIDRAFQSSIVLGNGNVVKGIGINFSNQSLGGEHYPLVFGAQAVGRYTPVAEASNCYPGSLDPEKVRGKIVVCVGSTGTMMASRRVKKVVAEGSGASGLVLIDDAKMDEPYDAGSFAFSQVGSHVGAQILDYINSTKNPTAVILPTEDVNEFKPAPTVASFSARGPGGLTESILKPDLMAPGVSILAAWVPPPNPAVVPAGKKPSAFAFLSGTSMACPHVAGAGAFLKSAHPGWTPSMIRSALMTTATTRDNLGRPVASSTGGAATGHDMGAGEISPLRALSPGLVFDTTDKDYLDFLCYMGYDDKAVRTVSGDARFACPRGGASPDRIATGFNYPSISVPRLLAGKPVAVSRTAMNVGPPNATYAVVVEAPSGLSVTVAPERLVFSDRWTTAAYVVSFASQAGASKGYAHGAVTWSDGAHWVRTPFAVNVV